MCIGEKVNELVFCISNYKYDDDPEKKMWEDITGALKILTKNRQVCTFEGDETGIYVIQYESDNLEFGTPIPIWMHEEDYDEYMFKKENGECGVCALPEEEFDSEAKE